MSKKNKKVCTTVKYIKHFHIVTFAVPECISIPAFASLAGIPIEITNSSIGSKNFVITAETKKHKLIIKKKKKKHDKIVLLPKTR